MFIAFIIRQGLGSIYKNRGESGYWNEYVVTKFEEDKMFIFSKKDGNYNVRYIFIPLGKDKMELEYFEWVEKGDLDEPFTQDILEKLKSVIENE